MYNNPTAGTAVGTAGTLAATGMGGLSTAWLVVAAITLVFAGLAVRNLVPAKKEEYND